MRLLICTQIVDRPDSTLGFFHRWIEEFAKHCEKIIVVCLKRGEFNLPDNVYTLSLGKPAQGWPTSGGGKLLAKFISLCRFYKYIWQERKNYDVVFVHMNQEYILLAGLLWKFWGKRIYFWRNHYAGSFLTDLAALFCTKVFCTSRYSYTNKYYQTVIMPVGFDTDVLKNLPDLSRLPHSILVLGRLSPSKNIHLIIEALNELGRFGVSFTADFYGHTPPKDLAYRERLISRVCELGLDEIINFYPGVPNTETRLLYARHEIVINASPSGMLDKTIFSAMGRGCLVLVSNRDLADQIPNQFIFEEGNVKDLTRALRAILALSDIEKNNYSRILQKFVLENHSLTNLATKLVTIMNLLV